MTYFLGMVIQHWGLQAWDAQYTGIGTLALFGIAVALGQDIKELVK